MRSETTHGGKTADSKVVATNGDLDGLYILSKSKLVYPFEAGCLRKVAPVNSDQIGIDVVLVLLKYVE